MAIVPSEIIQIELPSTLSLYMPGAGRTWIGEQIDRIRTRSSPRSPTVLVAPGNLGDLCSLMTAPDSHSTLRRDYAEGIELLGTLIESIRSAPAPWIFLGSGDIVGSWLELALGCHYRVWLNDRARLAVHPTVDGAFPPALAWTSPSKGALSDLFMFLKKHPVAVPSQWMEARWVDRVLDASEWPLDLSRLVETLLSSPPRWILNPEADASQTSQGPRFRLWPFRRRSSAPRGQGHPDSPEGVAPIGPQVPVHNSDYLQAATRVIETSAGKSWLARRRSMLTLGSEMLTALDSPARVEGESSVRRSRSLTSEAAGQRLRILVPCGAVIPPSQQLRRMFEANVHWHFWGQDPFDLASGLGILRGRLTEVVGRDVAEHYLKDSLSWGLEPCRNGLLTRDIEFSWTGMDTMTVGIHNGPVTTCLRYSGNEPNASEGLFEIHGEVWADLLRDHPLAASMLRRLHDGVIAVNLGTTFRRMHLGGYLRYAMLTEIVHYSRVTSRAPGDILDALSRRRWSRVCEERWWETWFDLQTPEDWAAYGQDILGLCPGRLRLEPDMAWGQILEPPRTKGRRSVLSALETTAIHEYFCSWLGGVWVAIEQASLLDSPGTIDQVLAFGLGMPQECRPIPRFLQDLGALRTVIALERCYPTEHASTVVRRLWEKQSAI